MGAAHAGPASAGLESTSRPIRATSSAASSPARFVVIALEEVNLHAKGTSAMVAEIVFRKRGRSCPGEQGSPGRDHTVILAVVPSNFVNVKPSKGSLNILLWFRRILMATQSPSNINCHPTDHRC